VGKNLLWFGEIERKLATLSLTTFTGTRQTEGENLAWFEEIERKLAKLSLTTFTGTRQTEGKNLAWRNRKKTSQIINDDLCLPFFLLIILCS
jgi:hypothetical protein